MKATNKTKPVYLAILSTLDAAWDLMQETNRAALRVGNRRDVVVVTDAPGGGWAVMDLNSAIELGNPYSWAV